MATFDTDDSAPLPELPSANGKRKKIILQLSAILLIITFCTFLYYWFFIRLYETTDDAYVGGFSINLSTQIDGMVTGFFVNDSEYVEAGQLIVELDPTDWLVALEESKAQLALAARQVAANVEDVAQKKAALELEKARLKRAQLDFEHRLKLVNTQAISKEDFEHAQTDLQAAESSVQLAYHQLQSALLTLGTTAPQNHPTIEVAKQNVKDHYINLQRCRILAPVSGYIAQRSVEVGDWVRKGIPMLSIIPLDGLWVDANFKETQLGSMRVGQEVTITTDIYGRSKVYRGSIAGIIAGTGSVFSLLPPQNATGNWIKIVQRVPVRIFLNPNDLKEHPLVLGLSAYVSVNLRDTSGPFLAQKNQSPKTSIETGIYHLSLEEIEKESERIIKDNLSFAKR
ncbi:MAG: HlyD family efflux transporter periplasmic adaptor subunit [Parachlamydiaceae bacterium]